VAWVAVAVLASGCTRDPAGSPPSAPTGAALAPSLDHVRRARVLFLHHSVGRDVLAGIEALDLEEGGGRIRQTPLEDAAAVGAGPLLAHFSGGRNGDPKSKMDAFVAALRGAPGVRFDLALMKLCYADFDPGTDVDALFVHYQQAISEARRARPDVRLAHVTVPLRTRPTDLGSRVRRMLGLEVWEDAANARRAEFSARIVSAFPRDALFDLAGAESAVPGARRETFDRGGGPHPALYAGYTDDGGHLNAAGRRAVGAAAIRFLSAALAPAAGPR
jgi:hypothetical protein